MIHKIRQIQVKRLRLMLRLTSSVRLTVTRLLVPDGLVWVSAADILITEQWKKYTWQPPWAEMLVWTHSMSNLEAWSSRKTSWSLVTLYLLYHQIPVL